MALLGPAAAHASHLPPDPNYVPHEPALSNEERGLLGLINDQRQAEGLAPLPLAHTLADPADRYANYLVATGQLGHDHYGTPSDRIGDAGWPMPAPWGETLYQGGTSARDAFEWWMDSPPHRAILISDRPTNAIGIGSRDGVWVADVAECPLGTDREAQCQLTNDFGDSGLAAAPEGADTGDEPAGSGGKLRLKAKQKGKRVQLAFSLPAGDRGLELAATRGAKTRSRALGGSGRVKIRLRLSRGHWVVEAATDSASLCRTLKIKRPRAKQGADRWVKVKTRPCSEAPRSRA